MDAVSVTWWGTVRRVVRRVAGYSRGRQGATCPHTADDLEHEGLIGAIAAVSRWEPGGGAKRENFCIEAGRFAIRKAVARFNRVVRVKSADWHAGRAERLTVTVGLCWQSGTEYEPTGVMPPEWCDRPVSDGARAEFRAAVRERFGVVSADSLAALERRFVDGVGQGEAAEAAGVSGSEVGRRTRLALDECRRLRATRERRERVRAEAVAAGGPVRVAEVDDDVPVLDTRGPGIVAEPEPEPVTADLIRAVLPAGDPAAGGVCWVPERGGLVAVFAAGESVPWWAMSRAEFLAAVGRARELL